MDSKNMLELNQKLQQARNELKNIRQQQYKLKVEMGLELDLIRKRLNQHDSTKAIEEVKNTFSAREKQQTTTESNVPVVSNEVYNFKPIGRIHSMYTFKNGTPRQATICDVGGAYLSINRDLFNNPSHCLEGLENFSHVWLMYVFHKNNVSDYRGAKIRPPRMDGVKVGLFSTRSPYRPNPVGLSLTSIDYIKDGRIYFRGGVDLLDGTPILDIKPYIPQYDSPAEQQRQRLPVSRNISCSTDNNSSNNDTCSNSSNFSNNSGHSTSKNSISNSRSSYCTSSEAINETADVILDSCIQQLNINDADQSDQILDNQNFTAGLTNSECSFTTQHSQNNCDSDCKNITSQGIKEIPGEFSESDNLSSACTEQSGTNNAIQSRAEVCFSAVRSTNEVSVAQWITNPVIPHLTVLITERAREQLRCFHSDSCLDERYRLKHLRSFEELEQSIKRVLEADPRSVYRRKQCSDRLYYFVIDVARVTCWFDKQISDEMRTVAEVVGVHPVS